MTTRRGFLASMLAVAAAPAIVRAGSLMPIYVPHRRIITPLVFDGVDDVMVTPPLLFNGGLMWQDADMTMPVTAVGQPVAYIERMVLQRGGARDEWLTAWAIGRGRSSLPTAGVDERGEAYVHLDGVDDALRYEVMRKGRQIATADLLPASGRPVKLKSVHVQVGLQVWE